MAAGLAWVSWQGWAALITFALQNGLAVLIMRWSKIRQPEPYSSQVAVLMQEVAIKLPISMVLYAKEVGGIRQCIVSIATDLRERSGEWLQLAVPALLYTVQNTLLYVGYANVDAAVGQITYQSKILWTALFSILILGKKLTPNQWIALCVLGFGIVAVQGMPDSKTKGRGRHVKGGRGATQGPVQVPIIGIGALIGAAICTAFASVYFEKMLKGASKPSLWLRNIQLAIYSSIIAVVGLLCSNDEALARNGWMAGFTVTTWMSVTWQALGGIIVAVTIKYADNILRGFAQALALIIGAIGSWMIFDFHLTFMFATGCALVIGAVFLYGSSAQTPQELCEALAGCNPVVEQGPSAAEVTSLTAATSDDTDPESAAEAGKAVPATRGAKEQVAES